MKLKPKATNKKGILFILVLLLYIWNLHMCNIKLVLYLILA